METQGNVRKDGYQFSFLSRDKYTTYHVSIIDYLQPYNLNKKVERWFKATFKGAVPEEISSIDAIPYAERFISFVKRVVLESYGERNRA